MSLLLVAVPVGLLVGRAGAHEAQRLWTARARLDFDDLVLAAAVVVLSVVTAWLCLATLFTAGTLLLRCSTGVPAVVATWVTPSLLRSLLTAACGAAVLTAPSTAPATTPAAGSPPPTAAPCRLPCSPSHAPLPAPLRPAPGYGGAGQPGVVVRAGDTLWAIAASHLPPRAPDADTATAWPLWFRLNRARLGPDPDLIHPGTRLRVPSRFARTQEDRS